MNTIENYVIHESNDIIDSTDEILNSLDKFNDYTLGMYVAKYYTIKKLADNMYHYQPLYDYEKNIHHIIEVFKKRNEVKA